MIRLAHRLACSTTVLAALAAGCGSSPADKTGGTGDKDATVLALANHEPGVRDVGAFVDAVRRLSHGTLEIRVRSLVHDQNVDYERAIIRDVRAGRYPLGKVGARAWDLAGVTSFQPLVAPFAITSLEQQERVLRSPLAREMLAGVAQQGVVGLALVPGELRYPVGITRDALRPADFHGAVVGVRPSGIAAATFAALGGKARGFVAGGSYAGMDIAEQDFSTLAGAAGLADARSVSANLPLWPRTQTIVMNRTAFDRLNDEQRDVLAAAASESAGPARRIVADITSEGLQALCGESHVRLRHATRSDIAALKRSVAPVYARLRRDPALGAAVDAIERMRAGTDAHACQPAASGREAPQARTALDGTWKANVTRHAYYAARPFAGEDHEGNWGPHTLKLDRGRFTIGNGRYPGRFVHGAYRVEGDRLLLQPEGTQDAGATWPYRWSLFRGTLRLRRDDTDVPTALRAVPWAQAR